jgi:hypothetical protein
MTPDTLHRLIGQLDAADMETRALIVMRMVQSGEAIWISPTTPGIGGGPATHQHEITIEGIEATGTDGATALANWITVAKRVCGLTTPRGVAA